MANLIRWDQVREMVSMRDSIDRVFEDLFSRIPENLKGYGMIVINRIQTDRIKHALNLKMGCSN